MENKSVEDVRKKLRSRYSVHPDLSRRIYGLDPEIHYQPHGKTDGFYLADDNYSYDSCKGILQYIHRYWLRRQVGPIARKSNQMFVIVDKEKEDTDRCFGTDSVILTKSIDFIGKTYEHHTQTSR